MLDLSEQSLAFHIWFSSTFLCLYSRINYLADSNRKAYTCSKRHLLCGLLISYWSYKYKFSANTVCWIKALQTKALRACVNQVQAIAFQGFSSWPFKPNTAPLRCGLTVHFMLGYTTYWQQRESVATTESQASASDRLDNLSLLE